MKGIPLTRYVDSINRHLWAWEEGDTSEDHLGAILWNAGCAAWTEEAIRNKVLPEELNDLPFRPHGNPGKKTKKPSVVKRSSSSGSSRLTSSGKLKA